MTHPSVSESLRTEETLWQCLVNVSRNVRDNIAVLDSFSQCYSVLVNSRKVSTSQDVRKGAREETLLPGGSWPTVCGASGPPPGVRHLPPVSAGSSSDIMWSQVSRKLINMEIMITRIRAVNIIWRITHRFCHSCIMTWLSEGRTCPDDNTTLTPDHIFPDSIARREIQQLSVRLALCLDR